MTTANPACYDIFGNPLSTFEADVAALVNDFIGGYVSYRTDAPAALQAADAHPDDGLLNAYAGIVWMFLEAPEAPRKAAPYVARARAAAGLNEREQLTVDYLTAWQRDDRNALHRLGEAAIERFPRDIVLHKIHQYQMFNRGDAPGMLRVALKAFPACTDIAEMHSVMAFGYEQCHLLGEAERYARQALELKPSDPWAQHALAHIMITEGRNSEGAAFLEERAETWPGLNSFMYTHFWWHLALFYLTQARTGDALALYDDNVWGIAPAYSQDQIGAVSLLARIELAGGDVGPRWAELGDYLAARGYDVVQPYLTLHYLYGLARAERPEARTLLHTIDLKAIDEGRDSVWDEAVRPVARALEAHARGDHAACVAALKPCLAAIQAVGGSHAQRELFEQIYVDAAMRAGDLIAAQQMLEPIRRNCPDNVVVNRRLAAVYRGLGIPCQAQAAEERAKVIG